MQQSFLFTLIWILSGIISSAQKKNVVPPGDLNLQTMIQPVPVTAKFISDTSYIWCGTLVKSHIDKKYHLFYSRWPRKYVKLHAPYNTSVEGVLKYGKVVYLKVIPDYRKSDIE